MERNLPYHCCNNWIPANEKLLDLMACGKLSGLTVWATSSHLKISRRLPMMCKRLGTMHGLPKSDIGLVSFLSTILPKCMWMNTCTTDSFQKLSRIPMTITLNCWSPLMSCCTLKEVLCNGKGAKLRLSSSIMAKSYGRDNPACATNYQDHILWSYAYFQDAASKKDYCNKSLFDPLWDHVHDLQQKLDGAGSSNETSTSVG